MSKALLVMVAALVVFFTGAQALFESSSVKPSNPAQENATEIMEINASEINETGTNITEIIEPLDSEQETNAIGVASERLGTRDNPVPMGAAVNLSDGWQIRVLKVIPDATDIILQEDNYYNQPPRDGSQYLLATIEAKYTGETSSVFEGAYRLCAVGPSSVGFCASDLDLIIPDPLPENEVFSGGVITGNVCFDVKSSDANSLVMYDSDTPFERRIYMALF